MRIEVLTVPGCPNGPVLTQRLATVLGDDPEVLVVQRSVTDPEEAARRGMRGSPTLLVDGRDPFADPDTPPSLSCRLYWAPDGSQQGAPSVEDLRHGTGHLVSRSIRRATLLILEAIAHVHARTASS